MKAELKEVEEALAAAEAERDALALRIPNPPARRRARRLDARTTSWSSGASASQPASADPHDHLELGRFDMERAARMSGARFGYWIGDTARLALALYRLALDRLAAAGFVTVLPPVLVREGALIGTGAFPSDEANVYELPADDLYLAGHGRDPGRQPPRRRDPRERRAAAPLRRVLDLLPPRGGRRGHATRAG